MISVSKKTLKRYLTLTGNVRTVTQEGVTQSQPGISVSTMSPSYSGQGVDLHLARYRNGKFQRLADNGKVFATNDDAWAYALDRGYIREYYSHLRPRRKVEGRTF